MNDMPQDEVVVLALAGDTAKLICTKPSAIAVLTTIGFVTHGNHMETPIKDDAGRKRLVKQLIGLGAIFSGGAGWSPAELLSYYREQEAIIEPYRMIVWRSPHDYLIETI